MNTFGLLWAPDFRPVAPVLGTHCSMAMINLFHFFVGSVTENKGNAVSPKDTVRIKFHSVHGTLNTKAQHLAKRLQNH